MIRTGENNLKKFLIHAASEIVFVLIGILAALQINNWNSNRKLIQTKNLHLQNLRADLLKEQEQLSHLKMIHEFKYEGFQYLLDLIEEPKYDPEIDGMQIPILDENPIWPQSIPTEFNKEFIDKIFLWSHRVAIFESNQTTLDEMNNAGTLSLIEDKELKLEIISYYKLWEGSFRILMRDLVEDWQKSLEKDGFITTTVYRKKDPLELLKNNPERIGKINRLARECVWWHNSAIRLTEKSESVIKLIDAEIES